MLKYGLLSRFWPKSRGVGRPGGYANTAGAPAVATLAFHALTFDATSYEMEGVQLGTGDLTSTCSTTHYSLGEDDVYREYAINSPVWVDGRYTANLFPYSEDATNWTFLIQCTEADQGDGSTIFEATGSSGYAGGRITSGHADGDTLLLAFDIKGIGDSVGKVAGCRVAGTGGTSTYYHTLTADYVRITTSVVLVSPLTNRDFYVILGLNSATLVSGDQVQVKRVMAERTDSSTIPSEYVQTPTATPVAVTYANANGNTVASNVVTEAVGSALATVPSLQYFPAATNAQIQSYDLTNVEWTATTMTTALDETGIDGVANKATTLTATDANSTHLANAITAASATQATCWYIKRKTGTGTVEVTVDGGTTWQGVTLTSSFVKFTLDQATVTDPQIGIRIVTDTDAVIVGNAECYTAKTIAKVRGLAPIFTTTGAVSTATTVYSWDIANAHYTEFAWYAEIVSGSDNARPAYIKYAQDSAPFERFSNTFLRVISNPDAKATVNPTLTLDTESKVGAVASADASLKVANGNGSYGTEVAFTDFDTGASITTGQSSNAGALMDTVYKMRNVRRYDITTYQQGKDKIDELMP